MTLPIPNWLERQKLIHSQSTKKASPVELIQIGNKCLDGGYLQDAFLYFKAANSKEGLERLRQIAINDGDAFLLDEVEKTLGGPTLPESWSKLGHRAFELGKFRFAKVAFEHAPDEAMSTKVREALGEPALVDETVENDSSAQ